MISWEILVQLYWFVVREIRTFQIVMSSRRVLNCKRKNIDKFFGYSYCLKKQDRQLAELNWPNRRVAPIGFAFFFLLSLFDDDVSFSVSDSSAHPVDSTKDMIELDEKIRWKKSTFWQTTCRRNILKTQKSFLSINIIIIISFSNHKTSLHSSHRPIVPFIVVTHDETDTKLQMQSTRVETSTISSVNMDNISLRGINQMNISQQKKKQMFFFVDYFSATPYPDSPILPDKLLSSISTNTTLSPPGAALTASATSLSSTGKRRGLGLSSGHRASHKRAHTGRLVSNINRIYSMKINKQKP